MVPFILPTIAACQFSCWLQIFYGAFNVPNSTYHLKQRLNFVSMMHNIGCIVLGISYYFTQSDQLILAIGTWSGTYFLADAMNYASFSLMQIHHYISVILMYFIYRFYFDRTNVNNQAVFWGLFWCEVSNIPIYYVYHYQCVRKRLTKHYYIWELVHFGIIRTVCTLYYTMINPVTSTPVYNVILGVWIMSMYWANNMSKNIVLT